MATFCTSCGRDVQEGWRFCGECGAAVEGAASAPTTRSSGADFAAPGDTTVVFSPPSGDRPGDPVAHATPMTGARTLTPAFSRRGLRSLAGWTEGVTWLVALMQLPALWFAVRQRTLVEEFERDGSLAVFFDLTDARDLWLSIFGLSVLLSIASIVLVMVWTYRIHGQVESLGAADLRLPRGFTIGAWFIPLANVVLLSMILSDLDRTTRADRLPIGRTWRDTSTAAIVWLWTLGAVASLVGLGLAGGDDSDLAVITAEELDLIVNGRIIQNVAIFATTAALAWYVRRVRGNTDRVTALAAQGTD